MRERLNNLYRLTVRALGSKWAFTAILAFFVIQASWIALSFSYPMIYDEAYHFPVIKIFSNHWTPFIIDQPNDYDGFGDLRYASSIFYHYLMSWPYRFIELITQSEMYQVIILRLLNIAMVATGLVVFARLFRKVEIKQTYINVGLLVFVLLPIVPFVSAHISYDNMLFLLTAIYMIFAIRLVQSTQVVWSDHVWLVAIGCLASLVKSTFLPVFTVSVLYILVLSIRRYGWQFFSKLWKSLQQTTRKYQTLPVVVLLILTGLFLGVYLRNTIQYGSLKPSCEVTLSKERCDVGPSGGIARRNAHAIETKDQRPAMNPAGFTENWLKNMRTGTMYTAGLTSNNRELVVSDPLPVMNLLIFFGPIAGIGLLLYAWRSIEKSSSWYFLIVMVVTLFLAIFLVNLNGYYKTHSFFANQPRYLLSVLPILLVMITVASAYALRGYKWLKLVALAVVLLLFTQGGGVVTHILRSQDNWYWSDSRVINANNTVRNILQPIVKEH